MTDLEYLKLSKPARILHGLSSFFMGIPKACLNGLKKLGGWFVRLGKCFAGNIKDLVETFVKGDWKTRISYLVMGFGSFARGQWGRGLLFFLFQTVFNLYMVGFGAAYLGNTYTADWTASAPGARTRIEALRELRADPLSDDLRRLDLGRMDA